MMRKHTCGAVAYTLTENQLAFLVEHVTPKYTAIPRGSKENGETDEETAVRAIGEKTGLTIEPDMVFRHDQYYPAYEELTMIFAARVDDKDMRTDYSSLEWLPYWEAVEKVTDEEDKDILSHAAVYLGVKHNLYIEKRDLILTGSGNGVWYRENAVDIHSHILPGLDDGAQSMEEAMKLLRLDWEEGIRAVFATPHYGIENGYAPTCNDTWFGINALMHEAKKAVPGMRIRFGTEWYCSDNIVERIRNHEAWPMMDSDWYLVEFMEWGNQTEPAEVMLRRLKDLQDNHIKTILAHPERYKAIQQDWNLAKRICDMDVLLQVNAYDLYLNPKDETRNLAQWMAKEEMISFIGSDMHGLPPKRPPKMKEGIRWLYENVDDEYANDIVRRNAERYLNVERLRVLQDEDNGDGWGRKEP